MKKFFDGAGLVTQNIVKSRLPKQKFQQLFAKYRYFCKNKKINEEKYRQKSLEFFRESDLNLLFDIASVDIIELINKDPLRLRERERKKI